MKSMQERSSDEIIEGLEQESRRLQTMIDDLEKELLGVQSKLRGAVATIKERDESLTGLEKRIVSLKEDLSEAETEADYFERNAVEASEAQTQVADSFIEIIQERFGRSTVESIKSDLKLRFGIEACVK